MDGKKNGYGKFVSFAGRTYEGTFLDDQMDGQGVMAWPDGTQWTGPVQKGHLNGMGTLIDKNGVKRPYKFENTLGRDVDTDKL